MAFSRMNAGSSNASKTSAHNRSSVKNLQRPDQSSSTAVGLQGPTPALVPRKSGTNTQAYMTPPQGPYTPEVKILVMGATGTGKSTFINLVSGSSLGVSEGLDPCTNTVQMGGAFELDGCRVVLIDTPGFNNATQSDTATLRTIVAFLGASYGQGVTLAGILYFHRISDVRMSGSQTRNFRMFQKLCGDVALRNVVIVTNMWSRVKLEVGEAREAELEREDMFFKPAIMKGSQMARHRDTVSSAQEIIRRLINNSPLPLQIQRELIDGGKDILDTSAGQELNQELNNEIRKHQEEIRNLTEEIEQATRDEDEEGRVELEDETKKVHERVRELEEEAQRLALEYRRERREFQTRFAEPGKERQEEPHRTDNPHRSRPDHSTPTAGDQFVDNPGRLDEGVAPRVLGGLIQNLCGAIAEFLRL